MARAADQVRAQGMSLRTAGPSEHFLPLATIRTRTGPTPDPCARSAMRSEIDRRRIQERLASRSNGGSGRSEPATTLLTQRGSLRAPSRSLRVATARLIRLAMRASPAGPGRGAGRTRTEVRCGMQAWLRAALREVVVISASPVIAQPHAWRSAGSGWRRWPVRAVTLWPGWAL